MRIDLLLKALCLAKTRSQARKGCDAGRVTLNGARAKPSAEARAGDVVEIRYPRKVLAVEVLETPAGQISRRDAARYYRVLRENDVEESGDWND
jgi:ribosomal 50S subunit-recycling heat shock protein